MKERENKLLFLSIVLLIIVHLAGIIGLHSSYRNLFLMATPFNLILSTFLLLLNHKEFSWSFLLFSLLAFLTGYFIEVLGVRSGSIFGHYYYGNSLGFKILNVPPIIGINWFILTYCTGIICDKVKSNIYVKACAGALMLVIMDLLIERIAPEFNFWFWLNGAIPMQNYVAWFIFSFLILLAFYKLPFKKENKLAPVLFVIQILFFAILGMI